MTTTKTSQIQLVIPGEPEFVGVVRLASAGISHRLDLDQESADDLKLVATEACGHLLSLGAEQVSICWELSEQRLTLTVRAVGDVEVEPDEAPDSGSWEEIGLLLIHSLMDEVEELQSPAGLRAVKNLTLPNE